MLPNRGLTMKIRAENVKKINRNKRIRHPAFNLFSLTFTKMLFIISLIGIYKVTI